MPLRDYEGWAIVVVDISIMEVKELPRIESREVMKMLKLLQMAYKEIFREAIEGEKTYMLGTRFLHSIHSVLFIYLNIYKACMYPG